MARALGEGFRNKRTHKPPPKKIEIQSINGNIYFLKKSNGNFSTTRFLGKHPENNKLFMLFGKAEDPILFAGNTNNELQRCTRGHIFPFRENDHLGKIIYHSIEFFSDKKRIVITIPADEPDTCLYSDDEHMNPTSLKRLDFKFIKNK